MTKEKSIIKKNDEEVIGAIKPVASKWITSNDSDSESETDNQNLADIQSTIKKAEQLETVKISKVDLLFAETPNIPNFISQNKPFEVQSFSTSTSNNNNKNESEIVDYEINESDMKKAFIPQVNIKKMTFHNDSKSKSSATDTKDSSNKHTSKRGGKQSDTDKETTAKVSSSNYHHRYIAHIYIILYLVISSYIYLSRVYV